MPLDMAGSDGFTYIGVLFAIAMAGIALAGTGVLWQFESRREKEKELLFIGEEYRQAITRYYERSPGSAKQYPMQLEDLLVDRRFPMPVHHLRRLYRDPMTQDGAWEVIRSQGHIVGVASRSKLVPIKISGFSGPQENFGEAKNYGGWQFTSQGGGASLQAPKGENPELAADGPQ